METWLHTMCKHKILKLANQGNGGKLWFLVMRWWENHLGKLLMNVKFG